MGLYGKWKAWREGSELVSSAGVITPSTQFPVKPNSSAKGVGGAGGGRRGREDHSCHRRTNLFHSAAHSRIPKAHLMLVSPLALLSLHFCKRGRTLGCHLGLQRTGPRCSAIYLFGLILLFIKRKTRFWKQIPDLKFINSNFIPLKNIWKCYSFIQNVAIEYLLFSGGSSRLENSVMNSSKIVPSWRLRPGGRESW